MKKIEQIIKKIKHYAKIIDKRGREYLTVMFIPHSEKKILTLHISYYTLFFIALILILVILFASVSIVATSTTKQEISNLLVKSKTWSEKDKIIRNKIEEINNILGKLKPDIENIYRLASANSSEDVDLWGEGGMSEITTKTQEIPISDDIIYINQIKNDLDLSARYLKRIKFFLKGKEELFSKIPSIWPLKVGGWITSGYGWRRHPLNRRRLEWHKGIDIAAWPGAPVIATADGKVIYAGWRGGYGQTVIIKHSYGFTTRYAHLSRIRAYAGKQVKKGDIIGYLGRSGLTTGYHLHYEIRIGVNDVNPMPYIINIK